MGGKAVKLTSDTVTMLMADSSMEMRAEAARQVAGSLDERLTGKEREIAAEIFRLMLRDAEMQVRSALSDSLKNNELVPLDVANGLAADVIEVARPILEHSTVLTDEDLLQIVRSQPPEYLQAIAKRQQVSSDVSQALVDSHDENIVLTLVGNKGAEIAEETYQQILDEHGENETINEVIIDRNKLPVAVAERLVTLVSDKLRAALVSRHELEPSTASDLVLEVREKATMGLLDKNSSAMDVLELVTQLKKNNRLTPSIMLRAICLGDIDFFETALDSGPHGLRAIVEKARLPVEMFPLIKTAVQVIDETEYDGRAGDRSRFVKSVVERILTSHEDEMSDGDLEYLIDKLRLYSGIGRKVA
jgi:uncharacterized protein (DUF2336 family)